MKIRQATPLLVALLFIIQGAQAETYTWITTTTGTFSGTSNWSPNSPAGGPGASDDITLLNPVTSSPTMLIDSNVTINSLTRNGTGSNWIIGAGATSGILNVGTITQNGVFTIIRNYNVSSLVTLSVNASNIMVTSGTIFFGAASASQAQYLNNLNVSGTTSIAAGAMYVNVENATRSYDLGLLSMSGGSINLAQSNNGTNRQTTTHVDGLTGAAGIIQGYGTSSQGSTTNSGTLAINNTQDFTSGAIIRDTQTAGYFGALSITKSGTGTQTLTGASTYTGNTVINEGTLKVGAGSTTGSIASTSNVIMTGTNATFAVDRSNAVTIANTISGSGRVLKVGTGTMELTAANTYTGGTVIENGSIRITSDANLGDASGAITFNNGTNDSRLELAQSITTNRNIALNGSSVRIGTEGVTNVSTINGVISGTGSVDKRYVGTLILTNANTYSGGTVITTGTLVAQNTVGSATGTGGLTVNAGRVLAGNGIIAPDAGNNITVAGNINPGLDSTATLTFDLAGASKLDFTTGSAINMTLGTSSDRIAFGTAGDWLSGSGLVTLNLTLGDGFSYGNSYVIFSDVTTAGFTLAGITGYDSDSYTANFSQVGSDYQVSFDAVPEPSTWMLLGCGLAFILWRSQRRKGTAR